MLLGLATITSPLTATIYFPLLPLLRIHFNVSTQAINLTLTLYIIFQALSPAIFAPISDYFGRRPIYLLTLSIYAVANVGLALNRNSYAVLLGLRMLQSLGASAAYAVSFGVVADVCVPSERGRMLGPVSMALNLGACVGPVVGGAVGYASGSYEWVFWALAIIGIVLLVAVGALLPETARNVVGNGGGRTRQNWWRGTWLSLGTRWLRDRGEKDEAKAATSTNEQPDDPPKAKYKLRDAIAPLRVIFHRDTVLVLWMHGSFYTVDYSLVAAVPDIFKNIYHFNELQIGLVYLARGTGIILGGYCNGILMDHNYKVVAKQIGYAVNKVTGDDLKRFPIERARSRGTLYLLIISTATLVGYGWTVNARAHYSILLVLQFIQGFWGTCFYTTFNTLLVDIFPESPSTAAAAASIMRCAMAAAGVAILQPLLVAAGRGWYFTALGLWSGIFGAVAVWGIRTKGMEWRTARSGKTEIAHCSGSSELEVGHRSQ